jgi:dimethylglycine dehydrogenase
MVSEECRAARESVAILDISSFAKYCISGRNAESALNRVLAGRLPSVGRIRLTPMLAHSGRLMGDLTTMRLADDRFLIGGSGYLQTWHTRWFAEHLAQDGVEIRNASDEYGGIAMVGPRARELLAMIAGGDVSNTALPFLGVVHLDLGFAPALVARLSVTGELGYEIYVPTAYLPTLLDEVLRASPLIGTRHAGMYALNSLRLEKSFGAWSREFSRDYSPRMAGLQRFIAYDRPLFIGRDAALRDLDAIPERRLVTLRVSSPEADANGYEPICMGDKIVGFVTSGGYAHCADTSVAMGYVDSFVQDDEDDLSVTILGKPCSCQILQHALIDPMGARMRG